MTTALRSELARLEGEVEEILAAATAEAHAAGWLDPRTSLLACAASDALQVRISDIRRTLARDEAAPTSIAGEAAPIPPAAPQPAPIVRAAPAPAIKEPPMTEEQRVARLTTLAAALGADDKMLAAALAGGASPDQFSVRVAEKRLHDQEVEAVVQRILASADAARPDDEVEAVVRRINAA